MITLIGVKAHKMRVRSQGSNSTENVPSSLVLLQDSILKKVVAVNLRCDAESHLGWLAQAWDITEQAEEHAHLFREASVHGDGALLAESFAEHSESVKAKNSGLSMAIEFAIRRAKVRKTPKAAEGFAANLVKALASWYQLELMCGAEVDWRPTETIPEDFYA